MAKINELKFELLLNAPYSPDLAPSDYFLFPNLKKWLSGQRFSNDEEVIEHRWEKCLELKGDYVEK